MRASPGNGRAPLITNHEEQLVLWRIPVLAHAQIVRALLIIHALALTVDHEEAVAAHLRKLTITQTNTSAHTSAHTRFCAHALLRSEGESCTCGLDATLDGR